jgi:hypothetical protein
VFRVEPPPRILDAKFTWRNQILGSVRRIFRAIFIRPEEVAISRPSALV